MVSFGRTRYRTSVRPFFAKGAYRQEGPTGQRGLLASGGGFGPGGLPLDYAPVGTFIQRVPCRGIARCRRRGEAGPWGSSLRRRRPRPVGGVAPPAPAVFVSVSVVFFF